MIESRSTQATATNLSLRARAALDSIARVTASSQATTPSTSPRTIVVAPVNPLTTGATVGGIYQLQEKLGRGTSATVYRAQHLKLGIAVAVKVLHAEALEHSPQLRHQLRSEAMLLAQLNHPNVIRIWDFDDAGTQPYLVSEFVCGFTLAERIAQVRMLPQDWAIDLARQVADGLAAAHRLGIVHRDVKPENIILTKTGEVKVADLGLAVMMNQKIATGPNNTPTTQMPTGTAAYMAPEQARSSATIDHRADMYSLGCTLYHALTGQIPFAGKSVMQVILKHLSESPTPPGDLVPLTPEANALILRLMAKNPADRFGSYAELLAAFDRVLAC